MLLFVVVVVVVVEGKDEAEELILAVMEVVALAVDEAELGLVVVVEREDEDEELTLAVVVVKVAFVDDGGLVVVVEREDEDEELTLDVVVVEVGFVDDGGLVVVVEREDEDEEVTLDVVVDGLGEGVVVKTDLEFELVVPDVTFNAVEVVGKAVGAVVVFSVEARRELVLDAIDDLEGVEVVVTREKPGTVAVTPQTSHFETVDP
jgi:hypothetical protein